MLIILSYRDVLGKKENPPVMGGLFEFKRNILSFYRNYFNVMTFQS